MSDHETYAKAMTNDELNLNDEIQKLNVLIRPFVILVSTFLRHSAFVLRHFDP